MLEMEYREEKLALAGTGLGRVGGGSIEPGIDMAGLSERGSGSEMLC